ncbi:MAG TPA: hypothetical protein VIK76_10895 [Pyrinomonadaceae bacterium]
MRKTFPVRAQKILGARAKIDQAGDGYFLFFLNRREFDDSFAALQGGEVGIVERGFCLEQLLEFGQ